MNRVFSVTATAIFSLVLVTVRVAAAPAVDDYFPLRRGTYWVYSANVDWTESNSAGAVRHAHVRLKSEVVAVFSTENLFAARLRGFVDDLSWYEPEKPRSDQVIVRVGSNRYYLINADTEKFWTKITSLPFDSRLEEIGEDNILLEAPLTKGAIYGEAAQTPRAWYCWAVTEERPVRLPRRVSRSPGLREYLVHFRTSPDHTIMGFTPGIGITHYDYAHHGTVANCRARLVEFHKG